MNHQILEWTKIEIVILNYLNLSNAFDYVLFYFYNTFGEMIHICDICSLNIISL